MALRLAEIFMLMALLASFGAAAQQNPPAQVETRHVQARLLVAADEVDADRYWAAVSFRLQPEWHLYWRNPGDSGEPPRFDWRLPQGWQAGAILWPTPERIPVGPLLNYGYSDAVTFMVPLRRTDAAAVDLDKIMVDAKWLVCREECIPESARLALTVDEVASALDVGDVKRTLPIRLPYQVGYDTDQTTLRLRILDFPVAEGGLATVWFASNEWGPVAPSGNQRWQVDDDHLVLTVPVGDLPPDGKRPLAGLLVITEHTGDGELVRGFALAADPVVMAGTGSVQRQLVVAMLLAFLGGLILNLMPCVLPVLAIKALSLAGGAGGSEKLSSGLYYLTGVVISVLLLAGTLLALRSGGESLGWGFQLQSPFFVALLASLMLLVALNLSGVFEIGGSWMSIGQGAGHRQGAFATGILAVLVASPCTAPFMGVALGYAMTQPVVSALAVFASLGIGFAMPMVLLSRWPSLLKRLPRPGHWMVLFRQALAFPMYATAAWLLWVVAQQVDAEGLARVLAGLLLVAFAAWIWGAAVGWRRRGAILIGTCGLLILRGSQFALTNEAAEQSQAWSPERVEHLRAEQRPVLVNFTAAWCITCKLNERVALSSDAVRTELERREVAYLKGDWTNRNPEIADELQRYGRSGVPLYLLYRPGQADPLLLPQILTEGVVIDALQNL